MKSEMSQDVSFGIQWCSRFQIKQFVSVGPYVPVVPDRVEAVKSPSGFLKAASELLIQAPIGTDYWSQILELDGR